MEKVLEERFEAARTEDEGVDLLDLAMGKFSPARADGGVTAQAAEEEFDFAEGKTHFGGESNEQNAIESIAGIAPLATGAYRWLEESNFFVVANGGSVEAGARGQVTDFHFYSL
jgi:hypothetical protein